jgi:hypothetical protein
LFRFCISSSLENETVTKGERSKNSWLSVWWRLIAHEIMAHPQ